MNGLTNRQKDVVKLIARGQSTKETAQALGISVKTVEKHRSVVMHKIGVHNAAQLTLYAVREGLVTP